MAEIAQAIGRSVAGRRRHRVLVLACWFTVEVVSDVRDFFTRPIGLWLLYTVDS
jgi:hypothetical protein